MVSGIALLGLAGCATKPVIEKPEAEIRAGLLRHVPVGSHVEKVDAYLRSIDEKAMVLQGPPPADLLAQTGGAGNPAPRAVTMCIYSIMGEYYMLPLQINVVGVWLIDANGKVLDVWVVKKKTQM